MLALQVATIIIFSAISATVSGTSPPVIGVLSQEPYSVSKYFPDKQYESYIAASYVKFVELSSAQVIPVWIGQNKSYYERVISYTNGLLFPGGAAYFNESNGYAEAALHLYNLAIKSNDEGTYYPILAICLGFEVLGYCATNGTDIRTDCSARNLALPLNFVTDYSSTNLFGQAPKPTIDILQTENVTFNEHRYCLTESTLDSYGLLSDWNIITNNRDVNDSEFISTMENTRYPIYGVMFHPEKNLFEFQTTKKIPHTRNAVVISQYFANFFISETLKNNNTFLDLQHKEAALIYNYKTAYIGKNTTAYEQVYVFDKDDVDNNQLL